MLEDMGSNSRILSIKNEIDQSSRQGKEDLHCGFAFGEKGKRPLINANNKR